MSDREVVVNLVYVDFYACFVQLHLNMSSFMGSILICSHFFKMS